MIKFLVSYLKTLPGVEIGQDKYGNLYAWKGKSETYPCIVAHIDQVQHTHSKDFKAIETRDIIFGYSAMKHQIEGLGGDDKNGVFICLETLKNYDCIKTVFFREEEIGCRGSSQDIDPEKWGYKEEQGMMTDVESLKEQGLSVSAVNISCGYYNPHSDEEITVKRDLEKCWKLVQHIIEDCTDTYPHEVGENIYGMYDEWEIEEEIHSILQQDPTMTGSDLYDIYQTNYPLLSPEDFNRIVDEYRTFYCCDDVELFNENHNGSKEDDHEILGFT